MDLWLAIVLIIVFAVIAGIVAFYAGINYRKKVAESQIGSAEKEAERIVEAAKESAEAKRKNPYLKVRMKSIVCVMKQTKNLTNAEERFSVRNAEYNKKRKLSKRK